MTTPLQIDQTDIAGVRYVRCSEITLSNPLDGLPVAQCREDAVTTLSDGTQYTVHERTLTVPYDPAASLPILDPTTGQQVSTMPMPQVFAILFSIYGAARAAAAAPP